MTARTQPTNGFDRLEIVRQHMEAEDRKDLDAVVACFTDDCYYRVPGLDLHLHGREQIRGWYTELFAAIPDMANECERYWSFQGETEPFVLYQAEMTGTHLGTLQGWHATGRCFRTGMLVRIPIAADGRMLAEEVYFDGAHLFRQLGILPPAGSRRERALRGAHAAAMHAHELVWALTGRRRP
jgi:steroid delta-isomerase-like uncharacterized protein